MGRRMRVLCGAFYAHTRPRTLRRRAYIRTQWCNKLANFRVSFHFQPDGFSRWLERDFWKASLNFSYLIVSKTR